MSITLFDSATDEVIFDVNFWHWRAIVEAVRALRVLPEVRVDPLHQPFVGDLDADEAHAVGAALRERLLPTLREGERVLLDGTRTMTPDDGVFYRDPAELHRNYGTTREVLLAFAEACERCSGLRVS